MHSRRRLDDPNDWVRIEIETLLRRADAVSVVPLLLGGATVPKPDDLPDSRANLPIYLPLGLLTCAWLRSLTGPLTGPDGAQSAPDEAREVVERRPMRLLLADIHLYRARLFFRELAYPWDKNINGKPRGPGDDLDEAEKLIKSCGYHRRDGELANARSALERLGMARSL